MDDTEDFILEQYKDKCIIKINSTYNTPNLYFSDTLSDETKRELRKNGWDFSARQNIWFPKTGNAKISPFEYASYFRNKFIKQLAIHNNDLRYTPNGRLSKLTKEEYIYANSTDFIEKFGDWKKIYNLYKFNLSEGLKFNGDLIINGENFKDLLNNSLKKKDLQSLHLIADKFISIVNGLHENLDTPDQSRIEFKKNTAGKEMLQKLIFSEHQVESILYVPEIIKNTIYITEEKNNEPEKRKDIIKYQYFLCGIKIESEDFTVKSVIAVDNKGRRYYDHKLSKIEKGNLFSNIDLITKQAGTKHFPLTNINDNRLLRVCQCPQKEYITEDFEPTSKTISLVKSGQLYITYDENGFCKLIDLSKEQNLKTASVPNVTISDSLLSFEQHKTNEFEIIGKRFDVDREGNPTFNGINALSKAMNIYSDKHYETARYLFIKDGTIIRHISVTTKTPGSTLTKDDNVFWYEIKKYAKKTDSKIVFLHNHPNGFVEPSQADINLTTLMDNFFNSNNENIFTSHIILDHGKYGLYLAEEKKWNALIDNKIYPIEEIEKQYKIQLSEIGYRAKFYGDNSVSEKSLQDMAEIVKKCDAGNVWNKKDWIPGFLMTESGVITSFEHINKLEFENINLLSDKLKELGRNYGSENVIFFPNTKEQFLICERYAHITGTVSEIYYQNKDGSYEQSKYPKGNLFRNIKKEEFIIKDTNEDIKEVKKKIFYEQSVEKTINNQNVDDIEQMESISSTMKFVTKNFMDLNATPITEIPFTKEKTEEFKQIEDESYRKDKFINENAGTFKALDDYLNNGTKPKNDEFIFKQVPEILKAANVSENEIVIKTRIINKARNEHHLSEQEIKDSVKSIASPVLIFDSDKNTTENKKNSFLSLTDTFAENGKPVAFSLNLDSEYERKNRFLNVNEIRSIHDRTLVAKNGTDLIQKWTENGLCRYVDDKKIFEWSKAARVYFPLAVLNSDKNKIKSFSDFVKEQKVSRSIVSKNAEKSNPQYQKIDELLQEYKQKYPESSLSISEDTRIELENVFSQIDDYLDNGIVPPERRFTLPNVPSYLKELGSDETAISLPVSVIKKAKETHGLSNAEIKNSLTRLYDPVAVFDTDKTKSENKVDSKLILTDEFSESKPIALALNTNTQIQVEEDGHRKLIEVQDIRSIHDRTLTAKNGTDLVKHWTENGLCRYVDDKKISEWSTVARVSFPIEALHSDKNNILTKSEIVNQHGIVAENERGYQKANEKELEQWYETVEWEDPMESAEAWQNGTQEQIAYIRKRRNEKIIDNRRLDDISELQEALKDALKQTAVPLEKIEFTRGNYNKLFPYSKIETPIESVKMGEHQFEKLEEKERQNILLAVHDTLKNPDLIINEQKENVFGENENNHIYAKSFLIDDKVHGVQSVVVSIDGENVSISTHERSINNIVNKIKKPNQLLYAAAKVRLLVERATGEQLVTVTLIRENEYVVSPQQNIQQKVDSVKQEENPGIKKSQIDFNKEIQNQVQEKKMENEMNQESELNIDEDGNEIMFDNSKSETENRKSIKAIDVWNEIYENIAENPEYKAIKFATLDYLYNKGTDDAAGYENSFERNIPRLEEIKNSDEQLGLLLEKYKDYKIDFDDEALAVKIAGTTHGNFSKAKQDLLDFVENKKYLRESEVTQEQEVSLFDKELQEFIDGKLSKSHIFSLGKPSEILVKCGFPAEQRIELSASHLEFKSKLDWHPFNMKDVMGLEEALKNPIAVFEYGDRKKSQNVIINIEKDGKKFLAGVHFNQEHNGFEISTIRTLFPKDTVEWLNWMNQGKMIYGDKQKLQALIAQQRINVADVNSQVAQSPLYEHCLESFLSILDKFGEVKDIFADEYPFYEDVKKKAAIEHKFFNYYVTKGNLDARELSVFEGDEFYNAIKSGDVAKIDEYTKTNLHEINELASEIYEEYLKEKHTERIQKENQYSTKAKDENKVKTSPIPKDVISEPVAKVTDATNQIRTLTEELNHLKESYAIVIKQNNDLHQKLEMIEQQQFKTKEVENSIGQSNAGSVVNSSNYNLSGGSPVIDFNRQTAFKENTKVPDFGLANEETGKLETIKNAVFSKLIENEFDNSKNEIELLVIDKDGKEKNVVISEQRYNCIINAYEKFINDKKTIAENENDYHWVKAHEDYNETMMLDENKFRFNTPENFIHNFRIHCKMEANNYQEALEIAAWMVNKMTPHARERFNRMRKQAGGEAYDRNLMHEFDQISKEKQIKEKDLSFDMEKENKLLSEMNRDFLEMKSGEKIPGTETRVGDTISFAIKTKGLDGKVRKTPKADFKIVKVSKNMIPNKAIIFNKKTNASYCIPLSDLTTHIQKVEREKIKEEKRQIKKDNKSYGYNGRM